MNARSVRFGFLVQLFSGWVNRRQLSVIVAVKGKVLGRRVLGEVAGIVTPDTILRWYRRLVARKYDGSRRWGPDRPRTKRDLAGLVLRVAKRLPAKDTAEHGARRLPDSWSRARPPPSMRVTPIAVGPM